MRRVHQPEHARARATRIEVLLCRTNVLASTRACTRLPPLDFHCKEGVDGSSPSEGFQKVLQIIALYARLVDEAEFIAAAARPRVTRRARQVDRNGSRKPRQRGSGRRDAVPG